MKFTVNTVFSAVDALSGPLGIMTKKATEAGSKISSIGSKLKSGFNAAAPALKTIGVGIAGMATAAGAAALAIYKLTESVSTAGDNVAKTARYLGMTTDAFQEFRYIGERSGLTVDEMDTALKKLTVNISKDSSEIEESLSMLGLTAERIKAAGPDEALNLIADGMAGITDPSTRAKIAVDIFGKSGIKMVNVLSEGRSGMKSLAEEAHRVGYVMGKETLDASEKLNDQILNMKTSFKAIGNELASKFMPIVTDAVMGVTDFLVENRSTIAGVVDSLLGVFQSLAPVAQSILPTLMEAVKSFGGILSKALEAATPILNKLGGAFEKLLPIVFEIVEVVGELLGPVFEMLEPILDILLPLLVGLANIISWLVRMLSALLKPLISMLAGIFKWLRDLLVGLWDGVLSTAKAVWDGIVSAAKGAAGLVQSAWNGITDFFSGVWKGISDGSDWLWDRIVDGAKAAFEMLKSIFAFYDNVQTNIQKFFGVDVEKKKAAEKEWAEGVLQKAGVPISGSTSVIESSKTTTSNVDVTFNNPPSGTTIKTTGPAAPGVNINMGRPAWTY